MSYFNGLFLSSNPCLDNELTTLFSPIITDLENDALGSIPDTLEINMAIS